MHQKRNNPFKKHTPHMIKISQNKATTSEEIIIVSLSAVAQIAFGQSNKIYVMIFLSATTFSPILYHHQYKIQKINI